MYHRPEHKFKYVITQSFGAHLNVAYRTIEILCELEGSTVNLWRMSASLRFNRWKEIWELYRFSSLLPNKNDGIRNMRCRKSWIVYAKTSQKPLSYLPQTAESWKNTFRTNFLKSWEFDLETVHIRSVLHRLWDFMIEDGRTRNWGTFSFSWHGRLISLHLSPWVVGAITSQLK